jgi:hypothetical protein
MQQRLAIFACNLKPAKMRGILSEGMIMCGSSPEKVEIIVPPQGAAIGDRVTVEGFPGQSGGHTLIGEAVELWSKAEIYWPLQRSVDSQVTVVRK